MHPMKGIGISRSIIVRYNLYDAIEEFDKYDEFISDMTEFSPSDSVYIYINSPGGRIDVGSSIVSAITHCKAKTTAVIEHPSASMASIIALSCDNLVMLEDSFLMFHNYSTGAGGKGAELMQSMAHGDQHFNAIIERYCTPFLTKPEIRKIRNDGDIYVYWNSEDLDKRKARHFK